MQFASLGKLMLETWKVTRLTRTHPELHTQRVDGAWRLQIAKMPDFMQRARDSNISNSQTQKQLTYLVI